MNETTQTAVRAVLKIVCGILMAHGYTDNSGAEAIVGAASGLIGVLWGVWSAAEAKNHRETATLLANRPTSAPSVPASDPSLTMIHGAPATATPAYPVEDMRGAAVSASGTKAAFIQRRMLDAMGISVALGLAFAWLTGCATTQQHVQTAQTITIAVETGINALATAAMFGWDAYVATGKASASDQAQVAALHAKFITASAAVEKATQDYFASLAAQAAANQAAGITNAPTGAIGVSQQIQTQLSALLAAGNDVIAAINAISGAQNPLASLSK